MLGFILHELCVENEEKLRVRIQKHRREGIERKLYCVEVCVCSVLQPSRFCSLLVMLVNMRQFYRLGSKTEVVFHLNLTLSTQTETDESMKRWKNDIGSEEYCKVKK